MTGKPVRILAVDDEPAIRKLLQTGLSIQGYDVVPAADGKAAIASLASDPPDLILLDLGLPDIQGQELLRQLSQKASTIPVVVVSSRTDESGIVEALDLGADDYVTKPFNMNELVARIRVALRHRLAQQGERPVFKVGDLSVDLVRRIVRVRDEEVKLSPKEYEILRLLIQHAGRVLTHRFVLRQVWGEAEDIQYLRVYIRQLRQKIEDDPGQPRYIHTETGVGYRMSEPEPSFA
jgi:two-component system, OmpR family, KDP operon response regulator KdpE